MNIPLASTFRARNVAIALLCLPYAGLVLYLARMQDFHSVAALLVSVALMQLLLASVTRDWQRFLLVQSPLVILSAAFSAYTVMYDIPPGRAFAFVLETTNWDEVRGFFTIWEGVRIALAGLIFAMLYIVAAWLTSPVPFIPNGTRLRWGSIGTIFLMTVYGATSPAAFMDGLAANPVIGSFLFMQGPLPEARAAINGLAFRKTPYGASKVVGEEVHVLVIGESARRDSWSAYGYRRGTTPLLDELRGEAVLLEHAMADANLTVYAVPIMLTGVHPPNYDPGKLTGSLLDLAHEAGYSTSWLINQDPGPSMLMGIHADRMLYANSLVSLVSRHVPFDEVLLPAMRGAIAQGGHARFIGLHIMGSHWEYKDRYPRTFERFGPVGGIDFMSAFSQRSDQRVVNAYDNSVAYTDWFLHQVISEARKLDVPATVTFFSDHGEDLFTLDGSAGHGGSRFSRGQFQIPAFVWVNPAYRRAHPDKFRALLKNSKRLIRSHNVFFTVADLMNIKWSKGSRSESFVSEDFEPDVDPRFIAGGPLIRVLDGTAIQDPAIAKGAP